MGGGFVASGGDGGLEGGGESDLTLPPSRSFCLDQRLLPESGPKQPNLLRLNFEDQVIRIRSHLYCKLHVRDHLRPCRSSADTVETHMTIHFFHVNTLKQMSLY